MTTSVPKDQTPTIGGQTADSDSVMECGDLSPLWVVAKRRWGSQEEQRFLNSHFQKFGQRGSAAIQSGDKSPHSTRRRPAKISGQFPA